MGWRLNICYLVMRRGFYWVFCGGFLLFVWVFCFGFVVFFVCLEFCVLGFFFLVLLVIFGGVFFGHSFHTYHQTLENIFCRWHKIGTALSLCLTVLCFFIGLSIVLCTQWISLWQSMEIGKHTIPSVSDAIWQILCLCVNLCCSGRQVWHSFPLPLIHIQ